MASNRTQRPATHTPAGQAVALCLIAALLLQLPWHIAHLRSHFIADTAPCAAHHTHCPPQSDDSAPAQPTHSDDCPQCDFFAHARHMTPAQAAPQPPFPPLSKPGVPHNREQVRSITLLANIAPRGPPMTLA